MLWNISFLCILKDVRLYAKCPEHFKLSIRKREHVRNIIANKFNSNEILYRFFYFSLKAFHLFSTSSFFYKTRHNIQHDTITVTTTTFDDKSRTHLYHSHQHHAEFHYQPHSRRLHFLDQFHPMQL